jgi:hypothetical protein
VIRVGSSGRRAAGTRNEGFLSDQGLAVAWAAGGAIVWQHPLTRGLTLPVTQPQTTDDPTSFVIQSAEGLARADCVGGQSVQHRGGPARGSRRAWARSPRVVWSKSLKTSLSDFVIARSAIYGFDDGIFYCLDFVTGKRRRLYVRNGEEMACYELPTQAGHESRSSKTLAFWPVLRSLVVWKSLSHRVV